MPALAQILPIVSLVLWLSQAKKGIKRITTGVVTVVTAIAAVLVRIPVVVIIRKRQSINLIEKFRSIPFTL